VNARATDELGLLSPYAREIFATHSGETEPLIRAELFGAQRFEEHGRSLAQAQAIQTTPTWRESQPFFPRVHENIAALRRAYDYIATISQSGQYVTPAAEWLLDNFHLVEAQLQQISEGVPRRYYADLPKLADKPLEGLPRVYGIAWAYVAHTDSVLDPYLFTAFLNAYQDVSELSLGELWALPTTLRVVLLENLRRVADQIAEGKASREAAHAVWDAPTPLREQALDELLDRFRSMGLERSFLTQLWQRMPDHPTEANTVVVRWTAQHCPNGLALIAESQSAQVSSNLTISNIINSLRMIGQVEWSELIEPVSRSLRVLRQLPNYALESEGTRKQITQAMEKMARDTGASEVQVAKAAVRSAQQAAAQPGFEVASGQGSSAFHLIGPGRAALAATVLAATTRPAQARGFQLLWPANRQAWRLPLYLLGLLVGTLMLLVFAAQGFHSLPDLAWQGWLALLLMAWPASEAVSAVINRVIAESTRVKSLPRLDFAQGIEARHRVLVVVPCMLTSTQGNSALTERLRLHWLANLEDNAQFALLSDWADAAEATLPADKGLLSDAVARVARLNATYPPANGQPPRFLVIHRPRVWSDTQGKWIGWERKRGKLEALVRVIATEHSESPAPFKGGEFIFSGDMVLATDIAYILTLDSDTGLPPAALRELVAIAAHPLNTPHIDTGLRRVTRGYGIFQPRVVTPLPQPEERTPFHAMFAGQCGIDPYSSGTSDLYQDLFDIGTFTGKGLLNVKAVYAVLNDRFDDNCVLSHDLLEGTLARCAYVSDVALVEDHPHHSGVDDSRHHRWTRGDWQLLPLMLRPKKYSIDHLGLWKMLDNLRRSLLVPASLALLIWVVFTAALPIAAALAVVLAAFLAGPLLGALAALVPTRRGIALLHFFHVGMAQVWRAICAALWHFSQLFAKSILQLDAIARALWRTLVSRNQLLQWTTAAQAQAAAKYALGAFVRANAPMSLACVVLAGLSLLGPHPVLGTVLFLVWACAPLTAWWASKPHGQTQAQQLSSGDKQYLLDIARATWQFFEACVGPTDNHLPPDNLQIDAEPTLAHRTSPTNMGLYLLSVSCAREFGWISTAQTIARLQDTLATMSRLPTHEGHFYNWYQTETLEVLQPAYVSTVDSGNLAGHLLAVSGACAAISRCAESTPDEKMQLKLIAQHCRKLAMSMDFRGLYNPKRHLFHIGLRVHEHALDASYYDLLASESRLASFFAIAKGDVPRRHWMALSRAFLSSGVTPGLKSWSGSMFEYLMPSLVMQEPEQGLLNTSNLAAIAEQQIFSLAQGLPWGISESAYFAQDHSLAYQYSPFGVPRLALRRTPATDRVVAPYASLMATMLVPTDAIANLRELEKLGARGEYGFMDAVDFTASRQPGTHRFSVVKNYMAHHQGMALVALCNVLCAQAPQRWFAQTPLVAAYDTLLHERCPRQVISTANPRGLPDFDDSALASTFQSRTVNPTSGKWQPTHLLSNGRYSVALRPNGAGVSRWRQGGVNRNINRWRDDLLRDRYGTFMYLRATPESQPYSVTSHPAPNPHWRYSALFLADRVQFDCATKELDVCTTVLVSPEDDTEIRTVVLSNLTQQEVTCEVISCFEVALSDAKADEAHPAFSNLFIDTEWHQPWRALVMSRRPRLHGEAVLSAAHFLAEADAEIVSVDCVADRRSFSGRSQSRAQPAMGQQAWHDHGAADHQPDKQPVNGLDPVACLRVKVRVPAGGIARLSFATAVALSKPDLISSIDKYLQPMHVARATRMAATLAQVRLRDLGIDVDENAALQDLTTALMYSTARAPAGSALVDQRQLWRFGISGEKPILLVRIHSSEGIALIQSLLRAQPWWSFGGLPTDVVVLNSEANSYESPLQREITVQRDRLTQKTQHSFPPTDAAGFYLLRDHEVSASEKLALAALARVIFTAEGRPIETQVTALQAIWGKRRNSQLDSRTYAASPPLPTAPVVSPATSTPAGRFDEATGEFQFDVDASHRPPRPWVNVIANAGFGFQISEAGSGYTWAINSRLHQVTPWSNDAVEDPTHEHFQLQDLATGELLHLTPGSTRTTTRHRIRHGQGYSVFESTHGHLDMRCTFFVDAADPVKLVHVELRNASDQPRKLRALAMVEWQMGAALAESQTLMCSASNDAPAVFAQQRESRAGFGGSTAFLAMAGMPGSVQWTCERSEFFTVGGQLEWPENMEHRSGGGLDPCGALASSFLLAPGEVHHYTMALGHAPDAAQAEQLAKRWCSKPSADVLQALADVKASWGDLQGHIQVHTPDPMFNALINRWLLYQTLTSRLWSKAGFYQAGGAFGFRDQLQDSMAFAVVAPERLRQQIVLNASRQFAEGDVQHWWHAPGGEGVRTHFSDDLLWLPFACAHYVDATGDVSVLSEAVPFISGAAIPDGAEDAYYAPEISEHTASVYEHCARTIDRSLATGVHGLPLMGTGDWNDGMNRVGHEGKGESVWLAWFLCRVAADFAPLALARGDDARARRWTNARLGWIESLHTHGWDGQYFKRAFFDNGAPLGSSSNSECRIDLIAQAWSVLSGASTPTFTGPALRAMNAQLVDNEEGLLHLLTPPLADSQNNPGYIQAYPPGVRENGGQYNHAAVWALMAQAQTGDAKAAWDSFRAISPAHRSQHPQRGPKYELEPYVIAGDIYGAAPYTGRGGWSWYTGSAAWLYRAALESLLGLKIRQGELSLSPCVPDDWPMFEVTLKLAGKSVTVRWQRTGSPDLKADCSVEAGEIVRLADLPDRALLVVFQLTKETS
jgi:cyclic beta-1,2-glucan synthetase